VLGLSNTRLKFSCRVKSVKNRLDRSLRVFEIGNRHAESFDLLLNVSDGQPTGTSLKKNPDGGGEPDGVFYVLAAQRRERSDRPAKMDNFPLGFSQVTFSLLLFLNGLFQIKLRFLERHAVDVVRHANARSVS